MVVSLYLKVVLTIVILRSVLKTLPFFVNCSSWWVLFSTTKYIWPIDSRVLRVLIEYLQIRTLYLLFSFTLILPILRNILTRITLLVLS